MQASYTTYHWNCDIIFIYDTHQIQKYFHIQNKQQKENSPSTPPPPQQKNPKKNKKQEKQNTSVIIFCIHVSEFNIYSRPTRLNLSNNRYMYKSDAIIYHSLYDHVFFQKHIPIAYWWKPGMAAILDSLRVGFWPLTPSPG